MTVTRYPLLTQASAMPSDGSSPDLTILNVSRLFARLEHNLLSSTADLKPLRRSEYQRMRVGAVGGFFFFFLSFFFLPSIGGRDASRILCRCIKLLHAW